MSKEQLQLRLSTKTGFSSLQDPEELLLVSLTVSVQNCCRAPEVSNLTGGRTNHRVQVQGHVTQKLGKILKNPDRSNLDIVI